MSGTCVTGGTGGGIGGGIAGGTGGGGGGGGVGGGSGGGGGGTTGGGSGGGTTMNNGGDTCEMATTITAGTIMGSTVGGVNSYDPGCTGDVTPGPDSVYKISVPPGQRLTATATPEQATSGNQFDLAVYLIEGPEANCNPNADGGISCVGASDDPNSLQVAETAGYFNGTSAAVDIFIVVDSYFDMMNNNPDGGIGASNEGNFTLTTTIAAPPAGDRCDTAQALTAGTPLMNQDMANYGDDYTSNSTGCRGSTAADATYSITVPAGQLLSVTVTPDPMFDPTLSITDGAAACGTTCIGGVDVGGDGDPDTLTYKNATAAAQTIYVIVDGYFGSTGTFSLSATLTTPPADDSCAAPIALTAGTALTAQTIATYSDDYDMGTGCGFTSGVDRVYSISVPNNQRVTVTATPTAMADVALSLVDGAANCGMACVAFGDDGFDGDAESMTFTNRSGSTQTYLIVADFYSGSTGTFDIVANVATPPADDVCQMPTTLTAGTPVAGTTNGYTNDYQNGMGTVGCSTTGVTGFDRAYQVAIPANQRGVLTVTPTTPDGGYNPSINLVEGAAAVCSAMPRVCAAGSNVSGANLPEKLSVFNTTGATRNFFALVDSSSGGGDFTIGYTVGTPAANDTCTTNNITLTAGVRATENLTGFENDYSTGTNCLGSRGPDRVYRVALAANERYTATVTPTADGGFDPVINFIAGPAANCEATPRTCRAGVDRTLRNQAETATFSNNSGGALDLFVVVADWETDSINRDFSLTSAISTAMAGESCQLPRVTTAGMVTGETTMGATADVVFATGATGCRPTGSSSDRVYSVSVGAGQTLTVTVTPAANEDMMINVIDGAAATCNNVMMCAAGADMGGAGAPETVTFMNSTGAAKVVFVQIAGYQSSNASYSLNVQIQ